MSDTGDDVIEVNGDSASSRAKLQQLRASAPFVRTLVTTFKHTSKMTKEQWKNLNMLSELLESENMSSAMFARCMESKLSNIETMINKLKSKYEPLLQPTEVIVIDDEQPSTAAKTNAINEMSTAVKETIPLNFGSIASQKCRANPPAPSPELTTVQDDLLERMSTTATIVDREPERLVAAEISAPKPDFERRSNPPKPTKPNLGLEPSLAARFPDIDSSIGSRRVDYVRISPRNTQTQLATLPKSTVFVRRPTVVPVPTADAETQRRSNPPAPAALEEARKKLAALAATPETTPSSPSDCTDPRGRSGSYATQIPPKASVSPIQSSAKGPTTSWPRKENIPVKKFPLPQSIPVFGSPSGSSAKSTTHTSPPTTKSIRVIGSAANINNNREHNVNLNMPNALHGSINLNYLSPGNVDGIANGFNNAQEASSTRRYGNLNGAGSRDPRRAKWGQSNGPLQQQQPQQHPTASHYSPQGGGQRRGGQTGWQTSNNPRNYSSYNPGGNPNGGNNNNNNPGWNNNNNNNSHFINGCPNFNYNNRPMFNRATSLGGGESNAPQKPGSNNINGPPYSGAPRTYREHLAAKAKQQEMQRQLEANEKQRQLEAAEKQRQLDAAAAETKRKLQEAEKLLDDGKAVAAPSRIESDNVQLDTSYRNVVLTGTTNKKLDFKIPKKASLEKVSRRNEVRVQNSDKTNTCEESIDVDNNNSEEQSSSKSNKTNKSSKSHKVTKTVHFDKEKSDSAEKEPKSDKTVDKEKADKSKKVVRVDKADSDKTDNSDAKHGSCSAAEKKKSENKKDEDVDETSNKPETPEKENTKHSRKDKSPAEKSNSNENMEKKKPTADNTDNVENEPPSVVETHEQQSANKQSEVESADSHQMSANAPTSDAINTTKSPLKEMPELKRILKRRKSMMPTASKLLVDKLELFGGVSLNYEDVVDHRREQQQLNANDEVTAEKIEVAQSSQQRVNRNLAIMFEKTSDNCSISTQNILAGKRRSQLNEAATKTAVENLLPPPPKKRSRRSELERLNDDIAQMYYANDVIRATGRRACSAQRRGSLRRQTTKKLRCAQLEQLLKCTKTSNMPAANIKAAAKRLIPRHKSKIAKLNKKKQSPRSKTNPKVRIRPISNKAKTEPLEQANSQPVTKQQKESIGSFSDMPPTRADEEQLLVINECKLEQNEFLQSSSQAERVKGATMPPAEAEWDSDIDVEVKLDVDDTSSPKLEVSISISATPIPRELLANESNAEEDPLSTAGELIQNVEQEEVAQQPEPEKEVEQPQQVEQQVEQQAQVAIEQADEEMLESQPDGNQDLDQQHTSEQNNEQQQVLDVDVDMGVKQKPHVEEQKENELEPDEEEELASEQRRKGSRSSNKGLFRNFNKICNKLMSRGSRSSSNTNCIGSASGSNIKGKPSNSPDHSSLENEVPELNSQPEVIVDLPSAPTVWPSETEVIPIQYMICVQNVAFRLRSSPTLKPAYYCRVPDCLFLFSNEIEGLENHFTRSHPSLRWNGSCTECSLPVKEVPDNLSVREELRHMVLAHVAPKPPEPAVDVAPPEPVLPKLRVRRFTGDRLVPEAEQAIEIEPEAVPREPVVENTTLRSLLLAQSCLPSHQQKQLNAAGVGEFLCAKTPPTTVDVPDIINRDSELGLQINHVCSLADTSIPLITGETVPLPVVTNDDYVITQSLTQNYEGPIPMEINISIEPRLTGSPPRKDRTQIAGNQFRCMAPNCNYCSHTVKCIREHMKFHSFSFGLKDYLQCSYCSHLSKDVDEYVQHSVLQHGLASREELQEPNADEVELPIAPAKLPIAGRQMVVTSLFHFVRKEVRYKCGVPDCGQHFDTELGLSQHLSTQHSYGDCFKCPHCHYVNHFLTLEKVLEHLKYHKRYVYQCGACRSFAPKRSIIDHHIHFKHASKLGDDVDVIIHKRDDLTMHTKIAEVRWFKSLYLPHTSTDEWFCNLCHAVLATEHQMIGHTAVAHQRMYQYCCPYCEYGCKDLISIVNHIRRSHASKRIQPLQCYLRIKCKNRQTLGFICNTCHAPTYTLYKMGNHCLQMHLNRFRYKCRHCDFGHTKHHPVVAHMTQEHPGLRGLPIQQFDRLSNDMLDDDFWNMAQIFSSKGHVEPPEAIASNNHAQAIQIFEPIELSSDEEDDLTNNAASAQKQYEFARQQQQQQILPTS